MRRPERYVLLFEVVVDFRVVPDELGEGFDNGQLYGMDAYSFVRTKSVLLGHRGHAHRRKHFILGLGAHSTVTDGDLRELHRRVRRREDRFRNVWLRKAMRTIGRYFFESDSGLTMNVPA